MEEKLLTAFLCRKRFVKKFASFVWGGNYYGYEFVHSLDAQLLSDGIQWEFLLVCTDGLDDF